MTNNKKMTTQRTRKPIKTKNFDEQTLNTLVNEINRLYILDRKTYLKQYIDKYGIPKTLTIKYDDSKPKSFNNLPLNDNFIRQHILGKERVNYGIFGQKVTKVLTFDIDIPDVNIAKFYYRKIQNALHELGLEEKNYSLSRSGKKGLHVDVYLDKVLTYKARQLYEHVIAMIRNDDIDRMYLPKPIDKCIELKSLTQGCKLIFAYHIESGNRACLLHRDTLKPIDDLKLCECEPLLAATLDDILDTLSDNLDDNEYFEPIMSDRDFVEQSQKLIENNNPLELYKFGIEEEYTTTYFNNLLTSDNAIKAHGTRNNLTFLLTIYIKDQYGVDVETCLAMINEWLSSQNPETYSTKLKVALEENKRTVYSVYEHDYHLNFRDKPINFYKSELIEVLTATKLDKKPYTVKQKSLLFALLVHAKQFTTVDKETGNSGIFFMTYDQMIEACPFTKRSLISETITELNKSGHIEIISRNVDDTPFRKKPNRYRVTLNKTIKKDITDATNINNVKEKAIRLRSTINSKTFFKVINKNFSRKELTKLNLSRKTVEHFLTIK